MVMATEAVKAMAVEAIVHVHVVHGSMLLVVHIMMGATVVMASRSFQA